MSKEIASKKVGTETLVVYEALNGYYLTLLQEGSTSITVGMGDGVDHFFDQDGKSIPPGTPEWAANCKADLEANFDEWMEAYFGE